VQALVRVALLSSDGLGRVKFHYLERMESDWYASR